MVQQLEHKNLDQTPLKVAGIILAGGKNCRMGRDKAFIEINHQRIIDQIVACYRTRFEEIILVTNNPLEYAYLGVRIVTDIFQNKGPLGGLYTGLFFARAAYGFVVACDMPMIKPEIITTMLDLIPSGADIYVPRVRGEWEPLFAIYSQKCLPHIRNMLKKNQLQIFRMYPHLRVQDVPEDLLAVLDPELNTFTNINTEEDLAKI